MSKVLETKSFANVAISIDGIEYAVIGCHMTAKNYFATVIHENGKKQNMKVGAGKWDEIVCDLLDCGADWIGGATKNKVGFPAKVTL